VIDYDFLRMLLIQIIILVDFLNAIKGLKKSISKENAKERYKVITISCESAF